MKNKSKLIFYDKLTVVKVNLNFLKIVKEIDKTQFFLSNFILPTISFFHTLIHFPRSSSFLRNGNLKLIYFY